MTKPPKSRRCLMLIPFRRCESAADDRVDLPSDPELKCIAEPGFRSLSLVLFLYYIRAQ